LSPPELPDFNQAELSPLDSHERPAKWEHQDEQMPDAFGYIVDGLESAFAKGYSDDSGNPSQIIWASRCRTA
jgi:hypothetical protein